VAIEEGTMMYPMLREDIHALEEQHQDASRCACHEQMLV
jgi:hypothetical protein